MPGYADRDILDRLYDGDVCSMAQNSCRNWMIREDAANEIQRLRSALQKIANTDPDDGTAWFHDVANKALKKEPTRE